MWQKIKCKLGFHDWDLEIVKNSGNGQECVLTYDEQVGHIYATVFMNIICKHCGKRLGSRIVRVSYSNKELGLIRMDNKKLLNHKTRKMNSKKICVSQVNS